MRSYRAEELEGHRIHIVGPTGNTTGRHVYVSDMTTGEMIDNVSILILKILPNDLIEAHLYLTHRGAVQETEDGSRLAPFTGSHFATTDVELDITAFVVQETESLL